MTKTTFRTIRKPAVLGSLKIARWHITASAYPRVYNAVTSGTR